MKKVLLFFIVLFFAVPGMAAVDCIDTVACNDAGINNIVKQIYTNSVDAQAGAVAAGGWSALVDYSCTFGSVVDQYQGHGYWVDDDVYLFLYAVDGVLPDGGGWPVGYEPQDSEEYLMWLRILHGLAGIACGLILWIAVILIL